MGRCVASRRAVDGGGLGLEAAARQVRLEDHRSARGKDVDLLRAGLRRAPGPAGPRLARARASASAREAAQLAQPRFKVDALGDVVPDIRAEAAMIYNPTTRQVLWEEKVFDQRSIASINRVMTAVCFLEDNPDLGRQAFVDRADTLGASVTYLRACERVSVQDLLHLLLIVSDNAAARALARVSPYGSQGFVVRMNQKAVSTHHLRRRR